jgi:ketosteroid isomerase-like protein
MTNGTDEQRIIAISHDLAAAIARRDAAAIAGLLAPGFTHRTHGGDVVRAEAFLAAVRTIPGDIEFVRVEELQVDVTPGGALVTGLQHARLRIDGQTLDDRRRFVDWFIQSAGEWRIQAAVDLPQQEPQ